MTAAGAGPHAADDTPDRPGLEPAGVVPGPERDPVPAQRPGPSRASGRWALRREPGAALRPAGAQWYPSLSPDMSTVLFATTTSPAGDTDRAIQTLDRRRHRPDDPVRRRRARSTPRPRGRRTARGSRSRATPNVDGANPERDMEIWVMDADGANPPAHPQRAARRGAGVVARRHDARLLERRGQRPRRHQRHDRGRRAPAAADRLRGPRRVARLAAHPRAGHRPPLRRRGDGGARRRAAGVSCRKALPARRRLVARRSGWADDDVATEDFGGTSASS